MHYKTLALFALASSAAASHQLHQRQDSGEIIDQNSMLSVLMTAIPASIMSVALTNQAAASSIIASEIAAGSPQSWISSLPSDIQSYLNGAATDIASITATAAPSAAATATTATAHSSSHTSSSTATATSSGSSAPSSTGGASISSPVGAGLAGVIGVLGMLVL